jgi:hypothetical protein
MQKQPILLLVIVMTAWLAAAGVQAQVTYETTTTTNGIMGMGAATSTVKTFIQGDARRQETQMKFTGSIMKHMSPKGTEIEITRLDKELFWKMNDSDKKYTEMTFAEFKKMIKEGFANLTAPGQPQKPEKEEKPEYEWQEPVVKAKNMGEKKTINNFACNRYLVTVTTIGKHIATGKLDTLLLSADLFNSINVGKAMKQISDFDRRLAEALGLDKASQMAMGPLVSQYSDQIKKLTEEMKKVEGYPVRSEMVFTMTTHATAAAQPKDAPSAKAEEPQQTDVTDVKGALGSVFGKKMKDMAKTKADKPRTDSSKKELFQSTSELVTIAAGDLAADLFEVPAGYKLQEKKQK